MAARRNNISARLLRQRRRLKQDGAAGAAALKLELLLHQLSNTAHADEWFVTAATMPGPGC